MLSIRFAAILHADHQAKPHAAWSTDGKQTLNNYLPKRALSTSAAPLDHELRQLRGLLRREWARWIVLLFVPLTPFRYLHLMATVGTYIVYLSRLTFWRVAFALGQGVRLSTRVYHGIDLIRILACALVVLNHFGEFPDNQGALIFPALKGFMHIGDIGVEIFFVISGFVIPFSAANSRPGQFLLKRFIRIYPAVLVSSFIAFGALCLASGNAASHIPALLRSLTLLPVGPWIDGVLWSLAVEIVFYCVIAFLIPLGARGRLMLAAWLGISSAVFTLAVAAVFYLDLHGLQQEAASSAIRYYWKISLVRHGVFFALGMLIHDLSHGNSDRSKRTCAIALTAVGAFQIVLFQHLSAPSIELAAASSVIKAGIWLLAIAALVVCIRRRAEIASLVGPWAGTVTSLGLLSYTLYLNHYTVGGVVGSALVAHGYNSVATLIITTSTILAISIWVQTGPERHLQDKLKQLLLARRVALART